MATPADDEMREAIAHAAAGIAILAIGPSAVKRKDSGGGGTGRPGAGGMRFAEPAGAPPRRGLKGSGNESNHHYWFWVGKRHFPSS